MKKVLFSLVLLFGLMQPAFAEQSWSYGWEDGAGTALGTYCTEGGDVILENSTEQAYEGTHSLKITEDPIGGTPQVYIWWVTGLQDGDTIDASFCCYDVTPGAYPSGRIWAHYTSDSEDITSYTGSASGNLEYSAGNGWSQLSYSWEFDSDGGTRDGFVIESRIYSEEGANVIYVDYTEITISSNTAIIYNAAGNTGGGGDTTPPTIHSANASNATTVSIIFSEGLDETIAETVSNYAISPSLNISDATLQNNNQVILTTDSQESGTIYTITVNNVEDLSGNVIEPNSTVNFTGYTPGSGPDLFFSEYIEGTSQNKALEIYNGTGATVDLANYRIAQSVNGTGWLYWHEFPAGSTLETGDVWVMTTDGADVQLQDVADEIIPYPGVVYHTGNDARGLEKTTDGGTSWTLVDIIGNPDEDPGDGWDVAGTPSATKDHTLVRKSSITEGTTDWTTSAGTTVEDSQWIVYPIDTFEYLGSHGENDTTPPTLASANATSSTSVEVTFDEQVDQTTAQTIANYSINNLTITDAILQALGKTVELITTAQDGGYAYTITVNNVEDLSGNVIEPNSTIGFTGYEEGPTEGQLIFSEYIEGSSNNKALEVYNASSQTVFLDNYRIVGSYDGGGWNTTYYAFPDGATLGVGDVWVIANESAAQTILSVADEILAYNAGGYVVSFNGNDARGIEMTTDGGATWTLIDVIGIPTEDPGTGWDVAGVSSATLDHTLVRKTAIQGGNTDWTSSAGTNEGDSEWIVYPIDTFEYLGSHSSGDTDPYIVGASATSSTNVNITFNEQISLDTAQNTSNYIIETLTISDAVLQAEGKTVALTTSGQTPGENYTIEVNNIQDLAGNTIEPGSTIGFTGYEEGPTEGQLIISEYIEGSSNNKALEVYNASSQTVYLDNYRIVSSYDGSGWSGNLYNFPTGATLGVGDVWVIANEDAAQTILSVADEILAYNAGGYIVSFNGNDARGIEITTDGGATWTLIDVIGIPTEDPGTGWDVAGVTAATYDHTLVRKTAIENGNTDWTSSAGTSEGNSEWIVYPIDTFDYIGSHGGGVGGNVSISNLDPEPGEAVTITLSYTDSLQNPILYWNTVRQNPFSHVAMSPAKDYSWEVELPGQEAGTVVFFYIAAKDTAETMYYFPEDAPEEVFEYDYAITDFSAILKVPHYTFCPTLGETFQIQFHSRTGDKIVLRLYNSEGVLVNTFTNKMSTGMDTFEWNGKDDNWNTLPPGLYICNLEVVNPDNGDIKNKSVPIVISAPLK